MASHLPDSILLVDRARELASAWREQFSEVDGVEVVEGDFFARPADALVSPANSFGIIDGGLDLAIRDRPGLEVQREVQRVIVERHHGELTVGHAEVVATKHHAWPFLVVAPTMRVPENVARTTNAYLAFRAVLLAVRRFNEQNTEARISSLVCPGLGTGIGAMDASICARQMRLAWTHVTGPARIPSFAHIHQVHRALHGV